MGCLVNQCCCCFKPRTGVLIYGYLLLVAGIGTLISFAAGVGGPNQPTQHDIDESEDFYSGAKTLQEFQGPFFIGYIVLAGFYIISALFAIIGGHRNNPKLLRIFFWLAIIATVGSLLTSLKPSIGGIVSVVINLAFGIYMLVVVRSAYLEMEEGRNGRTPY